MVLLGNADAGVAEQDRGLIDGNAGQKHFSREGIAKHVAVGALGSAVGIAQVGDREKPPVAALPVGYVGLGRPLPLQKNKGGLGLRPGGIDRSGSATSGGRGTKTGTPVLA